MVTIIKQSSGNVLIQGIGSDPTYHILKPNKDIFVQGDTIYLKEGGVIAYTLPFANVASTQLPPAVPAVPANIRELADTLQSDFF